VQGVEVGEGIGEGERIGVGDMGNGYGGGFRTLKPDRFL
jgi:hypothetical protein